MCSPVMIEKSRASGDEWHHEIQREEVGLPTACALELNEVEDEKRQGNDQ